MIVWITQDSGSDLHDEIMNMTMRCCLQILVAFSGFLINHTPVFFRWIPKMSFVTFAYSAVYQNEFDGLKLNVTTNADGSSIYSSGKHSHMNQAPMLSSTANHFYTWNHKTEPPLCCSASFHHTMFLWLVTNCNAAWNSPSVTVALFQVSMVVYA